MIHPRARPATGCLAVLPSRRNNDRMPPSRPPATPLRLEITPPVGPVFVAEFEGQEMVIGRARDTDLNLPDESLSRRHARLFRRGEDVLFEDLGSRNGSFLNEVPVSTPRR